MRRRALFAGATLLVWGVALCFVPLLNLLAFEFALLTTLPVTFLAGWLGARAPRTASGLGLALALTALPVVPITLNALRVRNCNYAEGLAFYLLLPVVTAAVAFLWGRACARLTPRFGYRLFLGVVVASVAVSLWQFWTQPPIDAFHWFVGYFPGSLYDEVIPLTGRLVGSRLADLGFAAGVFVLATRPGRLRSTGALLALAAWGAGAPLDLHRDDAHVQAALGGLRVNERYRLHHPASLEAAAVDRLMTELDFRHAELTAFFGKAPSEAIDVWFYEGTEQKKRLMGAGDVRIAKPWQRAVHLQTPDVGDGVLAHELAHAFSAEISNAPHHLSLTPWLLPNMGLIEGAATAAAWDEAPLDAHQWSQAMHVLGVGGRLEDLLDPRGFLAANSRAAYTQCGSFVRWLRETEGPAAVEALYRAGHLSPEQASALAGEWRRFLETQPVSPTALAMAKVRFDRPAIFRKVCAHEIAALRAEVEEVSPADPGAALKLVDRMLGHLPDDPDLTLTKIALTYRLDDPQARPLAEALSAREEVGLVRRARAREWLADLAAREGRRDEARAAYTALLAQAFDRPGTRRVAVKLASLDGGPWGERVLALLTRPEDAGEAESLLDAAAALAPHHPVVRYLRGRQAARRHRCEEGLSDSLAAVEAGLPHPALVLEALRLVAACKFERARYTEAAADFEALSARADLGLEAGERAGLATWARRARFFADRVN